MKIIVLGYTAHITASGYIARADIAKMAVLAGDFKNDYQALTAMRSARASLPKILIDQLGPLGHATHIRGNVRGGLDNSLFSGCYDHPLIWFATVDSGFKKLSAMLQTDYWLPILTRALRPQEPAVQVATEFEPVAGVEPPKATAADLLGAIRREAITDTMKGISEAAAILTFGAEGKTAAKVTIAEHHAYRNLVTAAVQHLADGGNMLASYMVTFHNAHNYPVIEAHRKVTGRSPLVNASNSLKARELLV